MFITYTYNNYNNSILTNNLQVDYDKFIINYFYYLIKKCIEKNKLDGKI
jgi:hypothetical protein